MNLRFILRQIYCLKMNLTSLKTFKLKKKFWGFFCLGIIQSDFQGGEGHGIGICLLIFSSWQLPWMLYNLHFN